MAIVNPENMSFTDKKFNVILYGAPGVGKTTLALSAPAPVLVDCDRGIGRVRADHRCPTIMPDKYEDILADLKSPEMQDFQTVIIDTGGSLVSMLQDWAVRQNPRVNAMKDGTISLKGHGAVKSEFLRFSEMLRTTLKKHVVTVFHSKEEEKNGVMSQRLLCDGAARNLVWTPADFGGYIDFVGDTRTAFFAPEESFFAKRCFGVQARYPLPDLAQGTPNDFLTRLFTEARNNIQRDADAFAAVKRQYAEAVAKGREIVSGVTDAATAQAATATIQEIPHALTSFPEVKALLAARLKEIGVRWDKARQTYVPIAPPPVTENPAQATNDAPQAEGSAA